MAIEITTADAATLAGIRAALGVSIILDVSAGGFIPRTSNGCGVGMLEETGTNKIDGDVLLFDASLDSFARVWFVWPSTWATCKAQFVWIPTDATGSVLFSAAVRVWTDGDAIDSAFGSAVTIGDVADTSDTLRISPLTAAITPSGTVAGGKPALLQIGRLATDGVDDHPDAVQLLHVILTPA
jgi:hypothetical protein